jgi:hypothetical protein
VPSQHGVILVNAVDEGVYFFKLPRAAAPVPKSSFYATPAIVTPGSSTTLEWSSDAASCLASGSWAGHKAIAGYELRSSISTNLPSC